MKRQALAFAIAVAAVLGLNAAVQAGVSLVAETPDAASTSSSAASAAPAAGKTDSAAQRANPLAQPMEKPFDDPHRADTVTIDAEADDPRCDFKPPKPALIAARYADYRAERNHDDSKGSPGDLTETATLADGTRVRVVSYGCVDSTGHTFEFVYAKPQRDANDAAFWAAQARKTLGSLALGEHVYGTKELSDWLQHAGTLTMHEHKIVQCHDSTTPADDSCNWESGGGFSLAIEAHGDAIAVTVGVDYSG